MQEPTDAATRPHANPCAGLAGLPWLISLALIIAVVAPCLLVGAAVLVLLAYLTH